MAEFSPTDSALEGFRLAREHPSTIAIWAVISMILTVATYVLLIPAVGAQLTEFMALASPQGGPGAQPQPADQEKLVALMSQMGPAMLRVYPPILLITLVVNAVISAANMRMVLRPEEHSPGFLRLGADELRILAVMIVKALILFGLSLVGSMLAGLSIALMGPIGALPAVLIFLALIAAGVVISVRLSLATPQTFAERRIMIFQSWGLTAGRFGPLIGCYLLTFVLMIVVLIVGSLLTGAITLAAGMIMGGAPKADFSSIQAFFTPLQIIELVLGSVISGMVLAIKGSPPAVIYQRLTGAQSVFT